MNDHIPSTRLSEYMDGSLPEIEKTGVERHLSACDVCSRELAGLRKVCESLCLFRTLAVKDPDRFVRSTMIRVRHRRTIRRIRHYAMPASAAAAVLIIAGIGFFDATFSGRGQIARQAKTQTVAVQTPAPASDVDYEDNVSSDMRIKAIKQVIEKNGARITKVTGDYVEGEALLSDYQGIRRDLDFTELPPSLAGMGMNLAGASDGGEMSVGSVNRSSQHVTFRIRRR